MVFKDWKNGDDLWVKNQRRLTTKDALSIDWFYCKSPTSEKEGLNPLNIEKSSVTCVDGDLNGLRQPVFKDRICDGFVDCFGLSDEDGRLGKCVENPERHPKDNRCPATIHGSHNNLIVCNPETELINEKPAWKCDGLGVNRNIFIFWVENLTADAWPKLRTGSILSLLNFFIFAPNNRK